jgi:hypothetical protein
MQQFTTIVVVTVVPQVLETKVIRLLPILAAPGSNVPKALFVIPGPDQVPPAGVTTRLTGAASLQNGPAGVMTAGQEIERGKLAGGV